jgi:hypothetical protein
MEEAGDDGTYYKRMTADRYRQERHRLLLECDKKIDRAARVETVDDMSTADMAIQYMKEYTDRINALKKEYNERGKNRRRPAR